QLLTHGALPDLELRLQYDAGKRGKDSRGDERDRHIEGLRYSIQFGRARAVSDYVEKSTQRQIVEYHPEQDHDHEHVDDRQRNSREGNFARDRHEVPGKHADDLTAPRVPLIEAEEQRAGTERGDERVDPGSR